MSTAGKAQKKPSSRRADRRARHVASVDAALATVPPSTAQSAPSTAQSAPWATVITASNCRSISVSDAEDLTAYREIVVVRYK